MQKISKTFSTEGVDISLEALLQAREDRAFLQQQLLAKYQKTLLSFTLTAVGSVKKNELYDYLFAKGLENLTACFNHLNIKPIEALIRPLETGHEALFVLAIEAATLKSEMIALEDSSPLSRLWDFDVIDKNGKLLSRAKFDFPPRSCLLCEQEAKVCARHRTHAIDEILAEMQNRAQAVYFAERIAELAYKALLKEVYLSPKPGLVDLENNGSHQDMTVQTFEQSAEALRPYFMQFVLKGMATYKADISQILSQIRPLGMLAEKAMYQATQNVNTHKGAIFAFGLVCTAIGRLYAQNKPYDVTAICHLVAEMTQGICDELKHYPKDQPLTAGVRFYQQYGLTGARGEAESGFILVQQALAMLQSHQDKSFEHQLQIALLFFMQHNQDTNVVNRAGMSGLSFVQTEAVKRLENKEILQNATALTQSLRELDQACVKQNISCGGSADLVALTAFFLSL